MLGIAYITFYRLLGGLSAPARAVLCITAFVDVARQILHVFLSYILVFAIDIFTFTVQYFLYKRKYKLYRKFLIKYPTFTLRLPKINYSGRCNPTQLELWLFLVATKLQQYLSFALNHVTTFTKNTF